MSNKVVKVEKKQWNQFEAVNKVVLYFVYLILGVFPLVFTDFYFNILETKYFFFVSASFVMMVALGFCLYKKRKPLFTEVSVGEKGLLVFTLISILSAALSEYKFEAFWGNEGRYTGTFLLLIYAAIYFCIRNFLVFKYKVIHLFLGTSLAVSIFGITDYFKMDILGFKRNLSVDQKMIYTSTLGNINTYTVYVGLALAVSVVLFACEKERKKAVFYYVCMVVSMLAIIMGNSDNAYLSIGALFGFAPFYLFRKRERILRYLVALASLFTVIQVIDWVNQTLSNDVLGITGVFNILANYQSLHIVVLFLWVFVAVLTVLFGRVGKKGKVLEQYAIYGWAVIVALGVVTIIYLVYDCNVMGNVEQYGSLGSYLAFDDSWGTNRGYIWRIAMENYDRFTPLQKLVGYGPDTFGIITTQNNYKAMLDTYGVVFESAHNEYIQLLLTTGILGLMSYLVFIIGSVVTMIKRGSDNPLVMACMFAVLAYSFQAIVNINIPIATPVLWVLMAAGISGCYKKSN